MIDFKNKKVFKLEKVNEKEIGKNILPKIEPILIDGENVIYAYTSMRDFVVFTNKRIIAVNVQGVFGGKKDFTSLPYSKIQAFSIESAGVFDMDAELELYYSALGLVKFEFSQDSNVLPISKVIAEYVL